MARRSPRDAERYARILSRYGPLLDGFIVPNRKNGEYYTRQYDGLPAPVVIPNAKLPSFGLVYDGRLHDAAGLPAAQRIILYAGSLIAERGLEKLIEVGFRLPPDWSMVLMGRGDLYDRLETIRQDMEGAPARTCRTPRVRILPPVSMASLPAWICGATVGVIPHEPTCLNQDLCVPHKLWDYASVGVPMLATDLPLISEAVRGAGMGWVVSACAPAAEIAAVIARLSDAEIDAARSGCTRFMEQEGWTVYEKSLLGLYRTVIDDGRDRRSATGMAPDAAAVGTT
jgi:glycosyltransferase involved in cell wall biosynthesis